MPSALSTATASSPRITSEVQPNLLDSMIAKTTLPSITVTRVWPTGSNRRARAARDSGTNSAVHTIAAATIGTLIQKMERQPKLSTRAPPRIGPSASDRPATAPKTPMALARSTRSRSEEHTSELQSQFHLVCRLLLEKKKNKKILSHIYKKNKNNK